MDAEAALPKKSPALRVPPFLLMAVDQGLLSVLTLFVNLVLIHAGTKPEYALFSIAMSWVLLAQSVQNGLICAPLVVLGGRLDPGEMPGFQSHLRRVNSLVAVVAALLCGGVSLLFFKGGAQSVWGLAVGCALAVVGTWQREYRRTHQVREGQLRALVTDDAMLGLVVIGTLILLVARGIPLTAVNVLVTLGIGNLLVSLRVILSRTPSASPSQEVLRDWTAQARLATTGSVVTWLQAASYPILVAAVAGTHAAAEVAAARLFLSPGLLLGTAWGRLGLVQATEAIREGGVVRWKDFVKERTLRVGLAAVAYVLLTGIALHYGASRLLGEDYQNGTLVWCWLAVGFVVILRSVASVALQAAVAFGEVLRWGVVSALVSCVLVLLLGSFWGTVGCVIGLGVGELINGIAFFALVARRNPRRA